MNIVNKLFMSNHIPFYISPMNKYLRAKLILSFLDQF